MGKVAEARSYIIAENKLEPESNNNLKNYDENIDPSRNINVHKHVTHCFDSDKLPKLDRYKIKAASKSLILTRYILHCLLFNLILFKFATVEI